MATEISPLDEDRMLKDAISNTESELFRGATDLAEPQEGDEAGDRTPEEMGDGLEGQIEDSKEDSEDSDDDTDTDPEEAEPEAEETAERDEKGQFKAKKDSEAEKSEVKDEPPKGRVPVAELLNERKARQAAEERATAAETKAAADLAAMNARLDNILLAQQRPAQPVTPAVKPEKPDMFAEPEKYEAWLRNDIAQGFTQQRIETSLADAHETHGEVFVKAYQELTGINIINAADRSVAGLNRQDPVAQATVSRIMAAPNPGRELMRWYTQQQTLREVGNDPAKYREGIESQARAKLMKDPEFRKQILADLKAEASGANGGQPRNVVRIPKSLSDAAGGTSANRHDMQSLGDSDAEVFADTWKTG